MPLAFTGPMLEKTIEALRQNLLQVVLQDRAEAVIMLLTEMKMDLLLKDLKDQMQVETQEVQDLAVVLQIEE
jgi:hypothetical protein